MQSFDQNELRQFARTLDSVLDESIRNISTQDSKLFTFFLVHLTHTRFCIRAIEDLSKNGLFVQADMIKRTVAEMLLDVNYVVKHPREAERWIDYQAVLRWRLYEVNKSRRLFPTKGVIGPGRVKRMKNDFANFKRKYGKDNLSSWRGKSLYAIVPKAKNVMAKRLRDIHGYVIKFASDAVHTSPMLSPSYYHRNDDGTAIPIKYDPKKEAASVALVLGWLILMLSMVTESDYSSIPSYDLKVLEEQFGRLERSLSNEGILSP